MIDADGGTDAGSLRPLLRTGYSQNSSECSLRSQSEECMLFRIVCSTSIRNNIQDDCGVCAEEDPPFRGWHGWVYDWRLHLVSAVAAVWIPLALLHWSSMERPLVQQLSSSAA